MAFVVVATFLEASFLLLGINPVAKPGGLLLGGVICLALTHWAGQVMQTGNRRLLLRTMAVAGLLCFVYVACFFAVDHAIASSVPSAAVPALRGALAAMVLGGFLVMFYLQIQLSSERRPEWLNTIYIHASNAFYTENNLRRILGALVTS